MVDGLPHADSGEQRPCSSALRHESQRGNSHSQRWMDQERCATIPVPERESRSRPPGENGQRSGYSSFTFCKAVEEGKIPRSFCESTDPGRLVPIFWNPEWIGIVVSGAPGRNQSKGYAQNHQQGPPTSKRIVLPKDWTELKQRYGPRKLGK